MRLQDMAHIWKYTFPLCLMTSMNEAISAARALGAPSYIDIPNRFYLFTLMLFLVMAETYESAMALYQNKLNHGILAYGPFLAAMYHMHQVIPHAFKICKRWTLAQIYGPVPYQKKNKGH